MTLATFVQISDLHLGDPSPDGPDAVVRDVWKYCPLCDGLLGHEYEACVKLSDFYYDLRSDTEEGLFGLITTGDFTSWGTPEQFDRASNFVSDRVQLDPLGEIPIGLEAANDLDLSIPGNHDHWPGHWPGGPWICGPPSPIMQYLFPGLPTLRDTYVLNNGRTLRVLRINTDANVRPYSLSRLLAKGKFQTEVTSLSKQLHRLSQQLAFLEATPTQEIRVLLLHHCRSYNAPAGTLGALEMTPASRKLLDQFVDEHNISALLSGHVHRPQVATTSMNGRAILEARCGTTAQLTQLPEGWKKSWWVPEERFRRDDNTLLVHELYEEGSSTYWHTTTYVRTPSGFTRHNELTTPWPHGTLEDRVRV